MNSEKTLEELICEECAPYHERGGVTIDCECTCHIDSIPDLEKAIAKGV